MAEAIARTSLALPARRLLTVRPRKLLAGGLAMALLVVLPIEAERAFLQSQLFSQIVERATAELAPGASDTVDFPHSGPYDVKHGYKRIPAFVERLRERGWQVEAQMRWSPWLRALHALGLPGPFREPNRPGLVLTGRDSSVLFDARNDEGYQRFDEVPPIVAASLLFIEDRHLLDAEPATRNPAIEWDRLLRAVIDYPLPGRGPGGSTLATQLEKLRHSPGGMTGAPTEKLRQMTAASLRAYREGPDTRSVREQLVVDYLNALPLGGAPGFGDVSGLDRGLIAWFGAEPAQVNALLHAVTTSSDPSPEAALAYRRVLALLIATRRPSTLLTSERDALEGRVDSQLRLLAAQHKIPAALASAAAELPLEFRTPGQIRDQLVDRKVVAPVRGPLTSLVGVADYPSLDALDLRVETTLDPQAQQAANAFLRGLADPAAARRAGIVGERLLEPTNDPAAVIWSFALYERGQQANRLLVQVDSGETPLDVHTGVRLDLGSTAKLRTLLLYLELVSDLRDELTGKPASELRETAAQAQAMRDALTAWVATRLAEQPDVSSADLLEQALDRRYSASPYESFFTGGGVHHFGNFDADYNSRIVTVREAFRHSVNLPFIRLMRDLVRHLEARILRAQDPANAQATRFVNLTRFVDHESQIFLQRFYRRYRDLPPESLLDAVWEGKRLTPQRAAVILRSVAPELSVAQFSAEMRRRLPAAEFDGETLADLYESYGQDRFDLHDRGYLARVHPLELWTVGWLRERRGDDSRNWETLRDESIEARMQAYRWLYRSNRRSTQDKRIDIVREMDAFEQVLRFWQRLGYPFETITPSYATAIGSSGDRPSSIAELLSVIVNDGRHQPTLRSERLRFAVGTPFETHMTPVLSPAEQTLRPEVAAAARTVLFDVVENGTARRARGAVLGSDGEPIAVAGKTGTGDHRAKSFDSGGRVTGERVVSRSAAFAFLVGDRHYGVVTAHVEGPDAANYHFTSSIAVQVFRDLGPVISDALTRESQRS